MCSTIILPQTKQGSFFPQGTTTDTELYTISVIISAYSHRGKTRTMFKYVIAIIYKCRKIGRKQEIPHFLKSIDTSDQIYLKEEHSVNVSRVFR